MNWFSKLKHCIKVWFAEDTIAGLAQILSPDDLATPDRPRLIPQMRRKLPDEISRLVPFWAITFCGEEAVITTRHEPMPNLEAEIMLEVARFLFDYKAASQVVWIFGDAIRLTTIKICEGQPRCIMGVIHG